MTLLYQALDWVMDICYSLCRNYGLAIILFTLLSKSVLLPLSVWVQKNSIKMVKMQPELNFIKAGMTNSRISMDFLGVDLSLVPSEKAGLLILSPVLAGVSAWILCFCQNKSNVLQAEQSKANQYGMMALSVGLSLYLGWFVPVGVALYWIASNLMATIQMYLLNMLINPHDYVNYEELEKSKQALR